MNLYTGFFIFIFYFFSLRLFFYGPFEFRQTLSKQPFLEYLIVRFTLNDFFSRKT